MNIFQLILYRIFEVIVGFFWVSILLIIYLFRGGTKARNFIDRTFNEKKSTI